MTAKTKAAASNQQKPKTVDSKASDAVKNKSSKIDAEQPSKLTICFTKPYGIYSRNDIATFDADKAKAILARKVAVEGTELPKDKESEDIPA